MTSVLFQDRIVLGDGIVLLKNYLDVAAQQKVANYLMSIFAGKEKQIEGLEQKPVSAGSGPSKGFVDVPYTLFDNKISNQICVEPLHIAQKLTTVGSINLKMVQLCYYTSRGRLGWHRDRITGLTDAEQDAISSAVISISLGDEAMFEYKQKIDDATQSIKLCSGDVLIFGGKSRMMWHQVSKVFANTCPKSLNMKDYKGRFNVTYREGAYYPENLGATVQSNTLK